jgi:arabinofuranan 3-O-arabinosyltransferase
VEPHDRAAQALSADRLSRTRFRLRLVAACAVLVGLAMVQSPGLLVPDTKFDLAAAPAEFLARAAHLWDPQGAFGQLQNQAYGYLWPMGPFFLLGWVADLPGWVVQRLWVALVMCVAMTGAAKVARQLGIRSDLACLVAGFAYALSPRMLTTMGPISIEAWPSALAPWVLLPLMIGSRRGSARRAAALSALAVAMVGGVNAAATSAVLPLGVLWLLTREPGPRRRTMLIWWPLFTVLGTLWWLVPLFAMGTYSPPFLDFIESASNTTFPTTLFDALRGTSNWVPYVDVQSRAGNDLIRLSYLALNSGVVLFLGLAGMLQRANPHRLFLSLGVVSGLLLVTMGHVQGVHGWAAADLRNFLDGPLAPLRNVHKFDPVLRLPLVLGLAWLVDGVLGRLRHDVAGAGQGPHPTLVPRLNGLVVVGTAVLAVVGASLPALAGRITPAGGMATVPDYWAEAAAWLGREGDRGTSLLVPGSSFGEYVWGSPRDEPLQSLAASPWAVRNAVPLAPAGNIRMLDAVEERLAQGVPSPGLAPYLSRAGVTYLVVRNDLARSTDVPDPVLVHQSVEGSPGLRRVATFGPDVGGKAHIQKKNGSRVVVNGGWQTEYPAIEIFAVDGGTAGSAVTANSAPVVVGGPEDLLDLAELGVLADEPTLLAADVEDRPDPSAPLILTDGLRATERNFGRVHDGASATSVPGEGRSLGNPTRDYLLDDQQRWSTTARIEGARAVRASSSMSDAAAIGTVQRGQLPYAAVDGDPATAWTANYRTNRPAWWQLDLGSPRRVDQVTVTAGPDNREVVRVRTAAHASRPITLEAGARRSVRLDDADATWLRVEDVSGRVGHRLAVAEVAVPGVSVQRSLRLPSTPARWGNPDVIVLRAVTDRRTGCVDVDRDVRCVVGRDVADEEPAGFRRTFGLAENGTYVADLRVRARPGDELARLLLRDQPVGVSGSSTGDPDQRASALAAVDGDPGTTWTASLADLRPTLRLSWIGQRRVTGLRLAVSGDAAARLPTKLTVIWPDGRREVSVDDDGEVSFPAVHTDQLTLRVDEAEPATSLDFDSVTSPLPVGIGELRVVGVPFLPVAVPASDVQYPCGTGPTVVVDGQIVQTSVTASPVELYDGSTVPAQLCGGGTVGLEAGDNVVEALASEVFTPTGLVLSTGDGAATAPQPVSIESSGPVRRTLTPDAPARLVAVKQNANPGWQAAQNGRALESVVLDGWQQGWRLTGDHAVTMSFGPDRVYRWGLLAGLVALLSLVLIACRRWSDTPCDPLHTRSASGPVLTGVAVLMGGLLAGWPGALLGGAACAVASVLNRRAPVSGPWVLAAAVLPAAVAYAVRPWGGSAGWAGTLEWPHYLVLVTCAALFGWPAERSPSRPRPFRRIPGFSTRR